jgi:SAM-dependent methyltransferase
MSSATMWQSVAPGWGEHAGYVDARTAHLTERVLELARVLPGDRVLELACGAGGLGLAAAECAGEVVLSDVAPAMVEIAAARARERGLDNVEALTLDLDAIAQPDASYDVVLCREGLMFADDPARAAREIARILKPGGRVALAVWGPRERNPWLGIVLDVVSEHIGAPVPPPGVNGPFTLGDAGRLRDLLEPFTDVAVEEFAVPLRAGSFDEWWARTTALAGPMARLLKQLPESELRIRARDRVHEYLTPGGLDIPGVALVASGNVRG